MTDDLSYARNIIGFHVSRRTYNDKTDMSENHYHHHYEILYIYESSRTLKIGSNEYNLDKNSIALIPPFIPHMTFSNSCAPQKRFMINFRPDFLERMEKALETDLLSCFNPLCPVISCEKHFNKFCTLMDLLSEDYMNIRNKSEKDLSILHLSEFLILLSKNSSPSQNKGEIYEIIKYIEKHFNEPINLELLEKVFYTSRYSISRKFNALTGLSIPKYVSAIRVIHSKKYIEKGMNLTDVALSCGFNSLNDFERVFRSETGTSPLKYKKSLDTLGTDTN
ncbi:MAG: helix-turn-helix transcriptional regulator [Clostridia bacterium]|nr:helix-turn-helix transcriptional regulator [Clostridia bacterium]